MVSNVLLILEDIKEGVTPDSLLPGYLNYLPMLKAGGAVLENDKTFHPRGSDSTASLQAH